MVITELILLNILGVLHLFRVSSVVHSVPGKKG